MKNDKIITLLLSIAVFLISGLIGLVIYIWNDNSRSNSAAHANIETMIKDVITSTKETNNTVIVNTYKIKTILDKNDEQDNRLTNLEGEVNHIKLKLR